MNNFDEIYRRYYEPIYRFIYRLIGEQARAEDITQDTFLKFYNLLEENKEIQNHQAWLYRVAANLSNNYLKRNNTFHRLISKNYPKAKSVENNTEDEILQNEKILLFRRALQKLPTRDQVLLQLYHDGLSYKEISKITDIKLTSVGKLLSRAISKCAKQIEKDQI